MSPFHVCRKGRHRSEDASRRSPVLCTCTRWSRRSTAIAPESSHPHRRQQADTAGAHTPRRVRAIRARGSLRPGPSWLWEALQGVRTGEAAHFQFSLCFQARVRTQLSLSYTAAVTHIGGEEKGPNEKDVRGGNGECGFTDTSPY